MGISYKVINCPKGQAFITGRLTMDILFSFYMVGAIVMLCFVILCMFLAVMGGEIPWNWFVQAVLIAATWPIMIAWGLAAVVWNKIRK